MRGLGVFSNTTASFITNNCLFSGYYRCGGCYF